MDGQTIQTDLQTHAWRDLKQYPPVSNNRSSVRKRSWRYNRWPTKVPSVASAFTRANLILKCFTSKHVQTLLHAFKTYVLPVIEYASSIWSPHYAADIRKVVRVQCKFTKCLLGCSILSYADRLAKLKLESLEVRRLRHDLILTYEFLLASLRCIKVTFFTFADRTHSTRGHA